MRKLMIVSCVLATFAFTAVVVATLRSTGTGTASAVAPPPEAVPPPARPSRAESRPTLLPKTAVRAPRVVETGACEASFYGEGQSTASGETFDPAALTAAHRTLPFGSRVRVTNEHNDESVTVRINDRGPFRPGRCLDLSTAAMRAIGGTGSGVVPVSYAVLAA
ncbi:MAG: septal ring lytic transglycosylase RlpA family protein [Streptosporangiaceae bacterium]